MPRRRKRKARRSGPCYAYSLGEPKSGGLVVDLRKIVLRGLRTVAHELADILGSRLGAVDQHFAAGAGEVRLDLIGFAQRLGRSELVDAGEERFRVLVDRLLNVAADLGGLGDRTGSGGLDRGGNLLGAGIDVGSALLGGLGLLLHELTGGFRNFHVLELGERLGDGREGFLDGVQHRIGLGGHWWSLHPQGLSNGLTPSGLARGTGYMARLMVRRNNDVAPRYHEFVIGCFPSNLPARWANGFPSGNPLTYCWTAA